MSDKRLKLIYFSTNDSDVKHLNLSWKKLSFMMFASFIFVLALVGAFFALFTDFYHNFKIEALSRVNAILTRQLNEMDTRVKTINDRMQELEVRDNDLRVYVNLPKIDEGTWNVGAGGSYSQNEYELRFLSKETGDQTMVIQMLLDKLERQLQLANKSQQDIEKAAREDKMLRSHTPSIQPVPGRISERFGMRLDPFIDKVKHHDGIDIPAEVGTQIFAPADGVIEKVENQFSQHKGYGKFLIIDHENGYKTKYAHLECSLVKEGQRVTRWQPIAEVGNTGKSTGPHLHYEVHYYGRPIDPVKNIFTDD